MSGRRRVLLALLAILLAGTGTSGWATFRTSAIERARDDASDVAEKVAIASTTYRYDRFDDGVDRVMDLSTDPFAKQYLSAAKTLKPLVVGAESSSTGRVVGSGVTSATTSKVVVVVLIDQRVHIGRTRRVDRSRMIITVLKVHRRWLVSELDLV